MQSPPISQAEIDARISPHIDELLALWWAEQGASTTFGIVPTRPETGHGYIQRGLPCELSASRSEAYHVAGFVEKPPLATAQHYISTGT